MIVLQVFATLPARVCRHVNHTKYKIKIAQHLDSRCVFLGAEGPNQNTSRIQYKEV